MADGRWQLGLEGVRRVERREMSSFVYGSESRSASRRDEKEKKEQEQGHQLAKAHDTPRHTEAWNLGTLEPKNP